LFSLGKVIVKDDNGEIIENHPLNQLLKNPNPFYSSKQLLWDYMFWLMTGNANLFVDSKNSIEDNRLYILNNSKIKYPDDVIEQRDKLFLSKQEVNNYKNKNIDYKWGNNNNVKKIPLDKLIHYSDLTSSTNGWHKGLSTLDALKKVITNSELSLDAKNIGLRFSGKYMVSGANDFDQVDKQMLSPEDKNDIEIKAVNNQPVHAVQSPIDIKRFVDDLAKLKLDEAFVNDLFKIGRIYNIPKDVIEAELNKGSTYENQEKARGNHVDYVMKPKGNDFVDGLMNYFGFEGNAEMTWDHLPFNFFRELERQKAQETKSKTFRNLVAAGMTVEEAKQIVYES